MTTPNEPAFRIGQVVVLNNEIISTVDYIYIQDSGGFLYHVNQFINARPACELQDYAEWLAARKEVTRG